MIELHRLHGNGTLVVNSDLIETIEATPDTVVTLVTKRRFVVEDSVPSIISAIADYRALVAARIAGGDTEDSTAGARALAAIDENREQAA